jgi:peptidoglycan/xylan/chitin deacetylase (PgdA/CDA1 family)
MSFKRALMSVGLATANRLGAARLGQFFARRNVVILCYHSIVDRPLPPRLARTGLHLDRHRFESQMEYLARRFEVVPLDEAVRFDPDERPGRRRSRPRVALTFDDGYANNLFLAGPVLGRLGLPATVFVVTRLVGVSDPFWWDELNLILGAESQRVVSLPSVGRFDLAEPGRPAALEARLRDRWMRVGPVERADDLRLLRDQLALPADPALRELLRPLSLAEIGLMPPSVRFGNHTATHRILDLVEPDLVEWEVATGRAELREMVAPARRSEVLCYPRGASGAAVWKTVAKLGIERAVGLQFGPSFQAAVRRTSNPLDFPRVVVGHHHDMDRFALDLAGIVVR